MTLAGNALAGYSDRREVNDFYRTPAWATHALFTKEKFEGNILEPACGDYAMSDVIQEYNLCVPKDVIYGQDFLKETQHYDNVVTNPPFILAQDFITQSKKLAGNKIALFLKLTFLEGRTAHY